MRASAPYLDLDIIIIYAASEHTVLTTGPVVYKRASFKSILAQWHNMLRGANHQLQRLQLRLSKSRLPYRNISFMQRKNQRGRQLG